MFHKVLIANRGEIAVRIAHTLQMLGCSVVAVFSDPDRRAPHVAAADEAYALDGTTPGETYLSTEKLIKIATRAGVDAIHPGYGFLSENAAFAQACADQHIRFIGPTPDVIRAMGDKIIAKQTMQAANVPVVPGWTGAADAALDDLQRAADDIGYPVLLKAAAGGGGKGMRIIPDAAALPAALEAARREADKAFGDARVFLEKYITEPRHVEFQIFGDTHGNVVHLFERECSIQRRYQKIIEESPSPALDTALREEMGAAAVAAARALRYTNAGTVEFIVDAAGAYYFLEVNTRLQVEHPVTELVTQHDLVKAQIDVATGEALPFTQRDLRQTGHAIECRIYAEDPARGFLPATGRLVHFQPPQAPFVRVDSGVREGDEVTVHYDPLLAKLIVWGRTREEAVDRTEWALQHFAIVGVTTNLSFLERIIMHPAFRAGALHTHFLEEHRIEPTRPGGTPNIALAAAAVTLQADAAARMAAQPAGPVPVDPQSPWRGATQWRNV
jgi:3-methylcrotonyl-CoA carboxylase alpha subunit